MIFLQKSTALSDSVQRFRALGAPGTSRGCDDCSIFRPFSELMDRASRDPTRILA
ncbi:hypothetical protein ACS0TY_036803 [Phlomoides rotata]